MKNRNMRTASIFKFTKTFVAVFIFAFVISYILIPNISRAATTDATLLFNPASIVAMPNGSNFNLVARINPGSNTAQGINVVQLDIIFDPAAVRINNIIASKPFTILGTPDLSIANENGTLSVPLFILGSQVIATTDVATMVFTSQEAKTASSIVFASTANAAANDGSGTPVVGTRVNAMLTSSSTVPLWVKISGQVVIIIIAGVIILKGMILFLNKPRKIKK
jgi:hypothetical protein